METNDYYRLQGFLLLVEPRQSTSGSCCVHLCDVDMKGVCCRQIAVPLEESFNK
jgi:hypothetical protein